MSWLECIVDQLTAVYLDLLNDPYWRVSALDAILAW